MKKQKKAKKVVEVFASSQSCRTFASANGKGARETDSPLVWPPSTEGTSSLNGLHGKEKNVVQASTG